MGQRAEQFLNSFNRIEKWIRMTLEASATMGFSEMTRRLAKRNPQVAQYEEDLLQFAQLRNAIVHEKIGNDFVIAEPNEWAITRIQKIEHELLEPEKVLPKYAKKVTGFEMDLPMLELFKIVASKRYSQFPIYDRGIFKGLITIRGIGLWAAIESLKGPIHSEHRQARELLLGNQKKINYRFVSKDAYVYEIREYFRKQPTLEAVLITKDGSPDGNLLGIVRPRDIQEEIEEVKQPL